jgi:NAD(P)-dependent dehydrogenase (short-subunit alcohol dehydrogenase family)
MGRAGIARIAKHDKISEDDAFALAGRMAALGQVLSPEEIAGLAVYLASDEARNVTGQAIVIDGGQVMP